MSPSSAASLLPPRHALGCNVRSLSSDALGPAHLGGPSVAGGILATVSCQFPGAGALGPVGCAVH